MPIQKVSAHQIVHNGRECWRVIVPKSIAGGKSKRKFFRTETLACRFAKEIEAQRASTGRTFFGLSDSDQAALLRCRERLGSVFEVERAVDLYARSKPKTQVTLEKLVNECMAAKREKNLDATYLRMLEMYVNQFIEGRREKSASEITVGEVDEWLHSRPWSAATQQGALKRVRTLFSFGMKRGYCISNPAEAVERPRSDAKPPGILTVDEAKALMRAAKSTDRGLMSYLALRLFAGLRASEAAQVVSSEILGKYIEVKAAKSKTRTRRLVSINKTLRAWLKVADTFSPKALQERLAVVRKKAGIPWPRNCLRHSFVSYSLPVHGIARTASEAGHSEGVLIQNYRELVTAEDAAKFWAIRP